MALQHLSYVDLPPHASPGGFDHAAVHRARALLYVAHTANDALDVIDCAHDRYLRSIPHLKQVAGVCLTPSPERKRSGTGVCVSEERNWVFTSNRGENTVGIFHPDDEAGLVKVAVGMRPNGLAYDPQHNLLLAANVGDPAIPGSTTASIIDVERRAMVADVPVPGRTRWAIFDPHSAAFYVNIAAPAQIVVINGRYPARIARVLDVPVAGPHGLDLDVARNRLFCACDSGTLIAMDLPSGGIAARAALSGVPDAVFFNAALDRVYVAVGDPGVIDVFDGATLARLETVTTEKGAHTMGFDPDRSKVYAFLPQTHRAAVYVDDA